MLQSVVVNMEAGVQQPPAKKPKKSMADFYKPVAKAIPKPVRNFRQGGSDAEMEASKKYEHLGVIGAIAVQGDATTPAEYFIRYPKQIIEDWTSIHDECMLLPHEDFKYNLIDVPAVDRASLGWDEQANGKDILFLYGKRGHHFWYYGRAH